LREVGSHDMSDAALRTRRPKLLIIKLSGIQNPDY